MLQLHRAQHIVWLGTAFFNQSGIYEDPEIISRTYWLQIQAGFLIALAEIVQVSWSVQLDVSGMAWLIESSDWIDWSKAESVDSLSAKRTEL